MTTTPKPARQFCRKGIHSCIPAVTLTFDGGARRLHWCAEHAADADRYRSSADADVVPFYTPAAGDADQYNELGEPSGYVHRSAG
jgi:hypothetical protein